MIKVELKRKITNRVLNGHPWIYSNEVATIHGRVEGGEVVEVFTFDRKFIGKGYINPKSQILVRLLTRHKDEDINEQFFLKKITECWEYRKKLTAKGLKAIESLNTDFNPDIHEAITQVPVEDKNLKGKIIDEVQKGYYLNDKIIRFPKVVVGK